jgi:hypothetical protein
MRRAMNTSNKDYLGGALMLLIGLAAIVAGSNYPLGTLSLMGPGFFPVALGAILALAGLAIAVRAGFARRESEAKVLPPEWRGWLCICTGIVAFVVLGNHGGLLPATFAIVFISALGDRQNTIISAAVLALAIVAVCVTVFWWALGVQFPLFTWG